MAPPVAPEEVRARFKECFRERPDIGVWKAALDLTLEPRNPFEPEQRRLPKRGSLIGVGLIAAAIGWFVYFNFVY